MTSRQLSFGSEKQSSSTRFGMTIECHPYVLDLRHQWTTSHSSTAQRTNALFTVTVARGVTTERNINNAGDDLVVGFGEVGMPPKNPSAGYYAEYADVEAFAARAVEKLNGLLPEAQDEAHLVALTIIGLDAITSTYSPGQEDTECMERFGKSGLQMALLDVLGRLWGVPVWCVAEAFTTLYRDNGKATSDVQLLANFGMDVCQQAKMDATKHHQSKADRTPQYAGYLTVSMNTPHEMAVNTLEALVATPFIKVKLDGDTSLSWERLTAIAASILDAGGDLPTPTVEVYPYADGPSRDRIPTYLHMLRAASFDASSVTLVVDANAAWSPEGSLEFIQLMKSAGDTPTGKLLQKSLRLLEQPFPTSIVQKCRSAIESHPAGGWVESDEVLSQWASLKRKFEEVGVLVFADESATVLKDLPMLCPFIHGVNIKLEKCGGILNAFDICHSVLDRTATTEEDGELSAIAHGGRGLSAIPTINDVSSLQFAWIGTMVSSRLGCNGAAQLLHLTAQGDVDGSLLVTEACQVHSGGFSWPAVGESGVEGSSCPHGRIALSPSPGLGCPAK